MRSTATVLASMAACAGVVDLWAVTSLGGAQLGALVVGATVAAVLLDVLWWSVPILAVLVLLVGVLARLSGEKRQQPQEHAGDDRGAGDGTDEGPEQGEPLR